MSAQSCLDGLDGLDDSEGMVIAALQSHAWDCVVVGGGIRTAEDQLELFERVILTTADLDSHRQDHVGGRVVRLTDRR